MNAKSHKLGFLLPVVLLFPALANGHHEREDWANVLEARPVTETLQIPADQEVCWDEQVQYRVPERRSATPLIFGAIIGGVIGNQFGGGSGQDLMTAAGAALGTSIAADQQARRHPPRYHSSMERRCRVDRHWRTEERIVAWDVTYEYLGEVYQTRMRDEPGDRIPVRVRVEPVN